MLSSSVLSLANGDTFFDKKLCKVLHSVHHSDHQKVMPHCNTCIYTHELPIRTLYVLANTHNMTKAISHGMLHLTLLCVTVVTSIVQLLVAK